MEEKDEQTKKTVDQLFDLSAGCYKFRLAYKKANWALFNRKKKKVAILKKWEAAWDAAEDKFDNFTFYASLAKAVPPTREKDYRLKIKALASKTENPEESLKICKELAPFLADIAERANFGRLWKDGRGYDDMSSEEIQELEEIFDEEWPKHDPEDLSNFMFYAPPSRKHLVVAEISWLCNTSAEEDLDLAIIKKCAGSAQSFLSTEDAQKVLYSWRYASLLFVNKTPDPIIMANSAEYLATEPIDYSQLAINLASLAIEVEKDDKLVLEALGKINLPRCLNVNAWRRFYQTAKNREDVDMIISRLNVHNKTTFGLKSLSRNWDEKKELILPAFCGFVAEEILATDDLATAITISDKFPDAIKQPAVYEHLIWLFQKQKMVKIAYDEDHKKRPEQIIGKLDKDYRAGYDLFVTVSRILGKESAAAKIIQLELYGCLREKILRGDFSLDQLRQLEKEFSGRINSLILEVYALEIRKKNLNRQTKPAERDQ